MIHEKLEQYQRELEMSQEDGAQVQQQEMKNQLNTIQENLTKVQLETVEDMPFSKFLVNNLILLYFQVRISNSYYQTIGKFTKQLLTTAKNNEAPTKANEMLPSRKKFAQKYKKR